MDNWFGKQRTLMQQWVCLEPLLEMAKGCTVLDIGCAEGLISFELMKAGAILVHGVDILESRIESAREKFVGYEAKFWVLDVAEIDKIDLLPKYDMVLLLAILHKIASPETLLNFAIERSNRYIVVRAEPIFHDRRSDNRPIKVRETLINAGFAQVHDCIGTFDEWVGIFEKG
jgi:SAM-dependent methyltransferase